MTDEEKAVWLKSSTAKEYRLHFLDPSIQDILINRIYSGTFKFENPLCDSSDIIFGTCASAKLDIQVSNVQEDIVGKEMEVSITCEGVTVPIGVFCVEEAPQKVNQTYKKIVAYDRMQRLKTNMADWYKSILPDANSTVSLKQFRDSFFDYLGLEHTSCTLINDDLIVRKTVDTNEISGIEIMQAVCEINGVLGHFNKNGIFQYISVLGSEETIDMIKIKAPEYESYSVAGINQLQIRGENGDIGHIETLANVPEGEENPYVVNGNFLCYGMSDDELSVIAKRLLDKIKDITYTPAHSELVGMPWIELGAAYRFANGSEVVNSIVLKHTLSGGQALRSQIDAEGLPFRDEEVNELNYQFEQLRGRTNALSRTVDGTVSKVADLEVQINGEKGIATIIQQLAGQIETTVTVGGEVVSKFAQVLGRFLFEGDTFEIQTKNIKIQGNVLEISDGYIGNLRIGSEGLSSDDYETLQIFKDGTGKFTNLSGNGKGFIYLKPKKDEKDEEEQAIIPFFKTKDGFLADYDSIANKSANIHCDSAGFAHFGLTNGDIQSSNEPATAEIVLTPEGATIQKSDGTLLDIKAGNISDGTNYNYSETPIPIGTWIDGETRVYSKTTRGSISSNGGDTIDVVLNLTAADVLKVVFYAENFTYPYTNDLNVNVNGNSTVKFICECYNGFTPYLKRVTNGAMSKYDGLVFSNGSTEYNVFKPYISNPSLTYDFIVGHVYQSGTGGTDNYYYASPLAFYNNFLLEKEGAFKITTEVTHASGKWVTDGTGKDSSYGGARFNTLRGLTTSYNPTAYSKINVIDTEAYSILNDSIVPLVPISFNRATSTIRLKKADGSNFTAGESYFITNKYFRGI